MATPEEIAEAKAYVKGLEEDVAIMFRTGANRAPSHAEITERAEDMARSEGRSYIDTKNFINSQPGLVTNAIEGFRGGIADKGQQLLGGAVGAVTDRSQSLHARDSSLPIVEVPLPGAAPLVNTVSSGINRLADLELGGRQSVERLPTDRPPSSLVFGAEDAADLIEVGGPMAAEAIILGSRSFGGLPGKIGASILANISTEVGAEAIRIADRKAANLPNSAVNISDPTDAALHFAKVAAGGALLGGADLAINAATLRAQRKAYTKAFGLGTDRSNAAIRASEEILGIEPNLAKAGTSGLVRVLGASLSVHPLIGRLAQNRARDITEGLTTRLGDSIDRLGDHLASGLHIAHRSAAWQKKNDDYLQWVRAKAGAQYEAAENLTVEAHTRLGREQVHVPHGTLVRADLEEFLLKEIAGLPLVGTGSGRRVATAAVERNADFRLLDDVLQLEDKADIVAYSSLRNELESAAARAGGPNDAVGRIFAEAARLMRRGTENMVAPNEVKLAHEVARIEWSNMHALTNAPAWKQFKRADSRFGFKNKIGSKQSTSIEVTAQNALADKDISPDIVETWWRAAVEADAVPQFRNVLSSHLNIGFQKSMHVPIKGPLEGVETVNLDRFARFIGADDVDSTKWAAHAQMIRRSGGDPEEVLRFLDAAKREFPDGIPNPSQTAARRVALSGLGSALRTTLGPGGSATRGADGAVVKGIRGAAAGLLALVGVGQLMYNPKILSRIRKVMDGGIAEQGRWRTLWGVAHAVGVTRSLQSLLQDNGIDPLIDATKAQQFRQTEQLINRRPLDGFQEPTIFSESELNVGKNQSAPTPSGPVLVPQRGSQ